MSSHPHFDDRGTLQWHTRFDDAKSAAAAEGKRVFIEMGRELCGNCRSLVTGVVPLPGVAEPLKEHFVALAADIDDLEAPLAELLMANMPDAMMLPFVVFTDAEGNWLAGGQGAVDPNSFKQTLADLTS